MAGKNEKRGVCEHGDVVPVAIDYEGEFLVVECANCTERFWRNVHRLEPWLEGGS